MGVEYTTYQFEDSERSFEDPIKSVKGLVDCVQDAIEVDRHEVILLGTDFVINCTAAHLLKNAVVINYSSRDRPYFRTTITSWGEPITNIVDRYKRFYCRDPEITKKSYSG